MLENPTMLNKQPGGWTLIVLLIVVAIIAVLMAIYLPSVLQIYSPATVEGEEGGKKPVLEHVGKQLKGIDERNKQINDLINQQTDRDQKQTEQDKQDQQEDDEE